MSTTLTQTQVSKLYVSIFNRASEGAGNKLWQNQNLSMADTATQMLDTQVAKDYFGTSLDTNQAFIEHIYLNTLNKTPADDSAGIAIWVAQLDSNAMTKGEVIATMIEAINTYAPGGANYDPTDTKTVEAYNQFENRVTVSDHMADTVETIEPTKASIDATTFSKGLIVTADSSTVTNANTIIDNMTHEVGDTFVVAGGGLFTGTGADDTFLASRGEIDNAVIKAEGGDDTLKATVSTTDDNNAALTTYDLENILIRNTAGDTTIDLLEANGLKEVWNDRSSDTTNLTLDGVSKEVTVGIKKTSTDTTVKYEDVAGSADAVTVKLDATEEGASFIATGIETLNLNVTSDSYLDVSGNSGLKNVNILGNSATSLRVDGTKDITITGGDGEDTLLLSGALGDNLEMSGIEKLAINASTTLDLDKVNVNEIISLDGKLTVTNLENEKVTVVAEHDALKGDLVATLKDDSGSADAISVEVINKDTTADGTSKLELNNIEVLNIETNAQAGANEKIDIDLTTSTTGGTNQQLNISGNALANITTSVTATTIDASANTAGVNLTLGASNQNITGTAQVDTFDIGGNSTADDTIDGGAGEDVIKFAVGADTVSAVTSNIEKAEVTFGGAYTFDASNLADVSTLLVDASNDTANVLSKVLTDTNIEIKGDVETSLEVTLNNATGTTDALNIVLDDAPTKLIDKLITPDIERLNFSESGTTVDTTTISTLDASSLTTLDFTGLNDNLEITTALNNTKGMDILLGNHASVKLALESGKTVSDTITFGDTTVGTVEISKFTVGIDDKADILDFSTYGVTSTTDLHIEYTSDGDADNITDGDYATITMPTDTNFGTIKLIGVDADSLESANFHFA